MSDLDTDNATQRSAGRTRHYMGRATDDPTYLAPANPNGDRSGSAKPFTAQADATAQKNTLRQYNRYLQTPKAGRTIFTSRYERRNRRLKRLLAALIVLAIALALVWFFILR